jgi:hypothetical protein
MFACSVGCRAQACTVSYMSQGELTGGTVIVWGTVQPLGATRLWRITSLRGHAVDRYALDHGDSTVSWHLLHVTECQSHERSCYTINTKYIWSATKVINSDTCAWFFSLCNPVWLSVPKVHYSHRASVLHKQLRYVPESSMEEILRGEVYKIA